MSNVHVVGNRDQFIAAQWAAKGGDTILLAPGTYQDLFVKNLSYASEVTISSLDPKNPAIVERLNISSTKNIVITDISFERVSANINPWHFDHLRVDNTENIRIHDNNFVGGLVNDGSADQGFINGTAIFGDRINNISIIDNNFTLVHKAVRISNSNNVSVIDNFIHDYREDGMFFSGIKGLLIDSNHIEAPNIFSSAEHADMMQLIGIKDGIIRNNFLNQADGDWTQGILLGKGGYAIADVGNVLIENNILYSGHHHGISTYDTPYVTIKNNLVLFNKASYAHEPTIGSYGSLSQNVSIINNITDGLWNSWNTLSNNGIIENNILVQRTDPSLPGHVGNFFRNAEADGAATFADLVLLPEKFAALNGAQGVNYELFPIALDFDPLATQSVVWGVTINLTEVPIIGYADQDAGSFTVSADGAAIDITGNAWKTIATPSSIGIDDWVRFDIEVLQVGEQFGIGVLKNGVVENGAMIQIAGDQIWGNQDYYLGLTPNSGRSEVSIPIGRFYQGEFDGLVVYADDDAASIGRAVFSNIRFGAAGAVGAPPPSQETVSASAPAAPSFFTSSPPQSFDPAGQDFGVAEIIENGAGVSVSGNGWKYVSQDVAIAADTVLAFDFKAPVTGEIHAIGFEINNILGDGAMGDTDRFFKLFGEQNWGNADFLQKGAVDDWVHVEIPVGAYLSGDIDRLVFVADDDANAQGVSAFRNIEWTTADAGLF